MGSDAGSWDINITIDAIDEATADLKKVSRALGNVDDATERASETTKQAGIDFTGFNQALEIGEKALQYTKQAYEALISPTTQYATQVRDLRLLTGMTAEDTSRLIQVNDDLGISFQTLQGTMEFASRNGFALSIDTLADMSDRYLGLNTAVERSNLLTDTFGRSGNDIALFMSQGGDAIRSMSEAISDNMIMTQQQIEQAELFRVTEDNLTDTLTGVKYAIGNGLIPWLQKAGDATLTLLNWTEALNGLYDRHRAEIVKTSGSYQEYRDEIVRSAIATDQINQAQLDLMESTENEAAINEWLTQQTGLLSESQWEWANSSRAAALDEYAAARSADDASVALGITEQAARDAADAQDELKTALDLVNTSMGELTTQMLYQQAAAGLDAESTLALARRLGLLDENTYSALRQVQDFKAGLVDLNGDGLISAAEGAGELITKVEQVNDSMVELYPGLTGVQTEMLNTSLDALDLADDMQTAAARGFSLRDSIDSIHDKDATVVVEFKAVGDVWAAGYSGYNQASYSQPLVNASTTPVSSLEQYVLENFAGGVDDYIVPPGYPNDRALIGVSSGEHVSVTPNGASWGSGVVNNYFNIYSNDPREVARQVARLLKQKGVVV